MLNVVFVVFGLIGLFALILRYFQQSGRFSFPLLNAKQQGVIVEPPIILDSKRRIVNITHRGQRYVLMLGPNNDVLLETSSAARSIEVAEFDRKNV
jgi:hypothetical protein